MTNKELVKINYPRACCDILWLEHDVTMWGILLEINKRDVSIIGLGLSPKTA